MLAWMLSGDHAWIEVHYINGSTIQCWTIIVQCKSSMFSCDPSPSWQYKLLSSCSFIVIRINIILELFSFENNEKMAHLWNHFAFLSRLHINWMKHCLELCTYNDLEWLWWHGSMVGKGSIFLHLGIHWEWDAHLIESIGIS